MAQWIRLLTQYTYATMGRNIFTRFYSCNILDLMFCPTTKASQFWAVLIMHHHFTHFWINNIIEPKKGLSTCYKQVQTSANFSVNKQSDCNRHPGEIFEKNGKIEMHEKYKYSFKNYFNPLLLEQMLSEKDHSPVGLFNVFQASHVLQV